MPTAESDRSLYGPAMNPQQDTKKTEIDKLYGQPGRTWIRVGLRTRLRSFAATPGRLSDLGPSHNRVEP